MARRDPWRGVPIYQSVRSEGVTDDIINCQTDGESAKSQRAGRDTTANVFTG